MPILYQLRLALRNTYVRLTLAVLLVLSIAGAMYLSNEVPQDASPLLRSQNIAEITALAGQEQRLEYLVVAKPLSDAPRYIFKFKDEKQLHVVKVPATSHLSLEREILLRNAIPYAIASDDYLAAHKAVLLDADDGPLQAAGALLKRHAFDIFLVLLMLFVLKFGIPGMGLSASVITPDKLKGSLDDLIGMEDIKQEVLHLEDMIRNRALYRSHNIDKPFNVMLTGPAGTGKTKLAGYLAKRLNVPLIQASGSALESGYIGGGSKALNALYRKACARGNCIIFLDEAQTLFMPRGRGEKKWEDDTANTLLGLLDGVKSEQGSGVIWVVASNFDDASSQMDEAMLRRFPVKINFRLPNKAERRDLLHSFLSRKEKGCVDWDHLDLGQVADITANLSPALLETVAERASMMAIQEHVLIDTELLFRAFERATIGLTDRAASAEKNLQRERVALHELGHFFMQIDPYLRQGMPLADIKQKSHLLKISTESVSKLGALGYVLSAGDDMALRTLEELERDVIQLYGGVAAEELFYGARGISIGSQNDIQKATTLLDTMVNKLSMYSRSKLDYSQLKHDNGADHTLLQVEAKADELYNYTLTAIADYKDVIELIKQDLLDRYVLSKDAVFALLEQHMAPSLA
ncbi:AAA family ATPase [Janthinobacterium agaricidamnosum]|uniref:ATPase associated with various cellular activities family protein n=1 Tax=Janthinobacterium agaricidamnosum NBRC 102515 = DSM 9628 TaxID=1349767 RepID=W0V0V1_9BURK|nr:AAA family ATPase [Janthinobacterium agaricidamnosum]CDG81250.1 ATPase associated with various cellular activities family protein [Janthinobacterium agaricidamnosum NBRC 102515 = DSM 9628]